MARHSSKLVVYAALAGNSLIAVTKFVAAGLTGSSAMLSEAVHSLVDTGNQGLMLYGDRQAARPPDERHPLGYGRELYFWTFIVAILIFAGGGAISTYEGVLKIQSPHPIEDVHINYLVLGLALLFEGGSWGVALREFNKSRGEVPYLRAIRRSKDPVLFTVLFEDTAALLGLLVALAGIALGQWLELPVMDGVASVVIGLILAATATFLAYEAKGLLIGEGVLPEIKQDILAMLRDQPGIVAINELRSLHLAPEEVLLVISLDFRSNLSGADIQTTISQLERAIKQRHPEIRRIFIEAQSAPAHRLDQQLAAADAGA